MIIINIAAIVVAIAIVALVVSLIPLIRELKATAVTVREIAVRMETDIQPTIKELHETLGELNVITAGAADKVEDIKCFMSAVGETGRGLRTISTVVGGAAGALAKSSLWFTGAKVAGSFLLDRFTKKKGVNEYV
jgi:uncharacterized protein YoxC